MTLIRLIVDPIDLKFGQIRGKIEEASRDFMAEVNLQQAKETHFLTKGVKPRATRIPCHLIPFSNRLFFPRPAIMEWIEAHLLPGESTSPTGLRSFLLHGLGGSGKTQLAAKFAHDHRNDYEIIIWAIADSEQKLADGFIEAAKALNIPHDGDARAIMTNVMNWLRECGLLSPCRRI